MIYTKRHLQSLLNKSYIEREMGAKYLLYASIFLAIATIAVHALLETVYESVVTDALPQIMLPSNYTIAFKYNLVAYLFFIVLFIVKYDSITFAQINLNKWYLLCKMGCNTNRLLLIKTKNTLGTVFVVFSVGYVLCLVLALLFKYTFIFGYLLSLFIVGLLDVMLLCWVIMLCSLFIRSRGTAAVVIVGYAFLTLLVKRVTGFSALSADRYLMTTTQNIFDPSVSPYVLIVLVALVCCVAATLAVAAYKASYYFIAPDKNDLRDFRSEKLIKARVDHSRGFKIAKIAFTGLMTVIVFIAIAANGFLLLMSLSSSSKEFSVNEYIPYIVQSTTMEDAIQKNDLVIFKKVDTLSPLAVGDVVLFTDNGSAKIEQITAVDENLYSLDITNYPDYIADNPMATVTVRSNIYGVLYKTNRWLGAVILFANSFLGRIVLFVIPVLLIFFNKQIFDLLRRKLHIND